MNQIDASSQELKNERLNDEHFKQAVKTILEDGFVILNNVIEHDHLDALREKMMEDTQVLLDAERWGGAGSVPGHLQQMPPPKAPYVFRDIIANPFVAQVAKGILGDGVYLRDYTSNTNTPRSGGESSQPLHRDISRELWPGLDVVHPPYTLAVNICLIEVTEERGAIELWPGTHTLLMGGGQITAKEEAIRRQEVPPVRGCTPKGALLIRDKRIWHRGMPNRSDQVRHMLGLMHNAMWLKGAGPLKFHKSVEPVFEGSELAPNYNFVDDVDDYLWLPRPQAPI